MNSLTIAQAAYVVAFTDGEGCITLLKKGRQKKHHNDTYSVHFSITNTNHSILSWLQVTTGIGLVHPKTDGKDNRKPQWVWFLRTEEIKEVLPIIIPYLQVKREQAELALEYFSLETGFSRFRGGIPDHIDIQRQLIWEDFTRLNKRGIY